MSTSADFQATTRHVLSEILYERQKQDERWGEQNHNPVEWISVEAEEFGEASMEANKAYWTTNEADKLMHLTLLREELIQVAAVAVAAIESLDRNELCDAPDFRQALGAIPLKPGTPTATEAIRKARDES